MNLKRVLVLVMALVMVVSACAPSVFAARNTETKHEHLDVLNNPELEEKYEEIKATVEYVAKDIEENHEEYYANGYAYALENGYIDTAIDVIKATLETLPQIDLEEVGMTEELRERLETELDALPGTLEKLLEILESDEVSEFDGFVEAVLTLEGDLYLHMNNIYAILEQASIDLNQFILVPAFNEAMRLLEEEVIPAVEATVDAVIDYVVEMLTPYYEKAVEILGVARDTYEALVETIVRINLFVENAIDKVVESYNRLVATILQIQDGVENAIRTASEIYNNVLDTVIALNAKVENAIENVENIVVAAVNAYKYAVKLLVKAYGTIENAIEVAHRVYNYVADLIVENVNNLENLAELAIDVYYDIVEIVKNAPAEANKFADYMVAELTAYVLGIINDVEGFVNDTHYGALNGSYELTDDSLFVALGSAPYGEALAGKLNLGNKYFNYNVTDLEDRLNVITKADLITVKVDNDELVAFTTKQVAGTVASVVRGNDNLMALYNHDLIGAYVQNVVADTGIDVNAQAEELDWSKYLDTDEVALLKNALALAKAELIERGVPEYYYIELQPVVDEILAENGFAGLPGLTINLDPIEVPVAELMVYALENVLYAQARYSHDLDALLETLELAAPNATIVLLGVDNPLYNFSFDFAELGIDCITYDDCLEISEKVIDVINAHLYLAAAEDANVVFVEANDADAIYDAIHVYCKHVYDDCLDVDCNRCLEVREAPGHSFTHYVFNNDSTCTQNGTETAKCDHCDATNTRTAQNSKLQHDWEAKTCTNPQTCKVCGTTTGRPAAHDYEDATCTTPKTCKDCGYVYGSELGHRFTPWEVVEEATRKQDGYETHHCTRCGLVENRVIPMILPKYPASTIITVILSAVVFAAALSAFILWRLRKRDLLK